MAEEKNKQYHGDDKHLDELRKCIIQKLEEAIEDLQDAGEKCEGHKMWYLVPGTPGNRIKDMINQLQQIIKEINSVVPELSDCFLNVTTSHLLEARSLTSGAFTVIKKISRERSYTKSLTLFKLFFK